MVSGAIREDETPRAGSKVKIGPARYDSFKYFIF